MLYSLIENLVDTLELIGFEVVMVRIFELFLVATVFVECSAKFAKFVEKWSSVAVVLTLVVTFLVEREIVKFV